MSDPRIPCPACKGSIRVRKSCALLTEDRTGLLVRECLVECHDCGRKGKMAVTLDIALYLDDDCLCIDPAPFPTKSVA